MKHMKLQFYTTLKFILLGLILSLLGSTQLKAQCTGCSITLSTSTSTSYTVNAGTVLCINAGVSATGNIRLNGGTVCNSGTLTNMTFLSGVFNNYNRFASSTAITAAINGICRINIYANAVFSVNANFNLAATTDAREMIINVEKAGQFRVANSSNTRGILTVNVGVNGTSTSTVPTLFEVQNNFAVNRMQLKLVNEANATCNFLGMSGFNNAWPKFITNRGNLNFGSAITVGGDGAGSGTFTLTNQSVCTFSDSYSSLMTNGTVSIVNDGTLTALSNITLNGINHRFTNNRQFIGSFDVLFDRCVALNTGTFTARSIRINNSSFLNTKTVELTRSFAMSHSLAVVNNNGYMKTNTDLTVSGGTLNLNEGSIFVASIFDNTIAGSVVTGTANVRNESTYGKLIILTTSQSSQVLDGSIIIHDQSLQATNSNLGYGLDAVSNTNLISQSVLFGSRSASSGGDPIVVNNCAVLANTYSLLATANTAPSATIACIGESVDLFSGFSALPPMPTNPSATTTTFTWQPINVVGSTPVVSPSVTTVYTVTATYNGCNFVATCTVFVNAPPIPTISYGSSTLVTAPANPTGTAFPVTLVGASGGVYSYSLSPGLNLNTSTGLITATNSLTFPGTYTVYYTLNQPTFSCNYTSSVVVTISDNLCSVGIDIETAELCHGDQFQIQVTVPANASYTWSPASGLSCANCTNPVLTYSLGAPTSYTLNVFTNGYWCGSQTFRVMPKMDCFDASITGCCFSNYGVAVYVSDATTNLNVYCNLLNEIAGLVSNTPLIIDKGQFESNGNVNVALDWIHNGLNSLYIVTPPLSVPQGTTAFIGSVPQLIRGNSVSHFNRLDLLGNGQRILQIDALANSDLNVSSNEFVIQQYNFFMKNSNANIHRTSGFASTSTHGYFSRLMASKTALPNKGYGFPLGSAASGTTTPYRYRPLEIYNNSTTQGDEVSANFVNAAPSLTLDADFQNPNALITNTLTNQSSVVFQRQQNYYHKIKNTQSNAPVSDIYIKSYYPSSDGAYTALSEWENVPGSANYWWGPTPGAAGSNSISTNALSQGLIHAIANGTLNFNGKPFVLASTGFSITNPGFSSGNGGQGNVIVISPSPTSSTNTSPAPGNPPGGGSQTVTTSSNTPGGPYTSTVVIGGAPPTTITETTMPMPGGAVSGTNVTAGPSGTYIVTNTLVTGPPGVSNETLTTTSGGVTTTTLINTVNNGNTTVTTYTIITINGTNTLTVLQTCTTVPTGTINTITCSTQTVGVNAPPVVITNTATSPNSNTISPNNSNNPYNPGNTPIPSNPTAGSYDILITPGNNCDLPAKLRFTITSNGIIDPNSVFFVDPVTNLPLGELTNDVYTIDNVNLSLNLSPSPIELLTACANSISISTSTLGDYVLDRTNNPNEVITIAFPTGAPAQLQLQGGAAGISFSDYNNNLMNVNDYTVSGSLGQWTVSSFLTGMPNGVYEIAFVINNGSGIPAYSKTIKGQIIIK